MEDVGFHTLIDEIGLKWGLGGCVKEGQQVHVSLFIPSKGLVSADQFVDWTLLANNINPNSHLPRSDRLKQCVRDAFVRHMGAELVDARRLSWDAYEAEMCAVGGR